MTARGESVLRLEDERLLRGSGCFTADIRLENELRMFVVRSPHAAARIVSIETADAARQPGVVAVLTGCDYQADGWGHPTSRHKDFLGPRRNVDGSEFFAPPNVVLPVDRVRHVGDAVAIVVATSLNAARDAADHVRVAVTGGTPCVQRIPALERALEKHFDENALADWAPDVAAFASNLHASAAYRAELARVGVRRAVRSITASLAR